MQWFRNILVPIEGDPAQQPVLARAVQLAGRSGAAIRLVAVVEDFPWYTQVVLPNAEEVMAALVRERSEALGHLAAQLGRGGVEVSTDVLRGRRRIELVREVLRGGHDLLMKEAEPNPSVLFGSTDMQLLRTCPCPVWLFRPDHAGRPFSKILAAVDPEPPPAESDVLNLKDDRGPAEKALDWKILKLSAALAEMDGSELHVVHAWWAPGEAILRGEVMLDQAQVDRYVEDAHAAARKALNHLVTEIPDPSGKRVAHLISGEPSEIIADFAETNGVDLIVMGTIARTGIPGLLIGNTAEAILQRVGCSVLAVKPDGFVSPIALND